MNNQLLTSEKSVGTAIVRLLILLGLSFWLLWPQFTAMALASAASSEKAHALVVPVAILALIYCRREALSEKPMNSSGWGILFLLVGIGLYAFTTWPFDYGYVRNLAMLPVLAGIILIACGWRILKLSLPLLLLVALAIPVGSRLYASFVIRPETITISTTAKLLDLLPGVQAWIKGTDLFFSTKAYSGIVALGVTNRGSRLLLTFAVIGAFVTFSRIRSPRRLVGIAVASVPIIFFGNFLRFLSWALIDIYTGFDPANAIPRNLSAIFAIVFVYGLFAFVGEFNFGFSDKGDQPVLEIITND